MNVISEILRGVWMMDPLVGSQYFPIVHNMLSGGLSMIKDIDSGVYEKTHQNQSRLFSQEGDSPKTVDAYDLYYNPEKITQPSTFILDIVGPITKYNQMCGPLGMQTKAQWIRQADAHPQVFAHLLRIDSPGGEGYACRYFSDAIRSLNKPVFSFVEGMAASAAYWIASTTGFVAASNQMDRLGSIGTYMTVADYSAWYQSQGIRLIEVYAQKSTDKNQDYLSAIAGDTSAMRSLADSFNDFFLQTVKHNRREIIQDETLWGTGKMFFASEAQSIGLIDAIMPLETLLNEIHIHYSPK